ncbi:hypothetical protein [Microbacterium sp. LWH3-1.2]|uniref:hypothetical protein n=1 Tax=Microbacterium sp. LWH3-1.2 TaxID=3135256 RepID=UPI0034495998
MLASTDAALGQKVVSGTAVPARLRQSLDVQSGLNDGSAGRAPFLVVLDIANAELDAGDSLAAISHMAAQIDAGSWGLAAGARWDVVRSPGSSPR